jgi:small subunit ribosomal protein S8
MSMTDPIADMLTRIRNAITARHERVDIPSSRMKGSIAGLMKEESYISNYRVIKDRGQGVLRIFLRYSGGEPVILGIKRISKPGRRVYCRGDEIPRIRGGFGIAIVSTSKGILTDSQAREMGVGGEVVCAVW